MAKHLLPPIDKADLFKLNQVIHKLDDAMGGDYSSSLAMHLREIRDLLFGNEGQPIAYNDYDTEPDYIAEYINR